MAIYPDPQALAELGEHPEGGAVQVLSGRYGPYVKWGKVNATLPRDVTPESLTMEQALELISAKASKGGKKPAAKKAAKEPAKAAAKKPAARKTAKAAEKAPARTAPRKAAATTWRRVRWRWCYWVPAAAPPMTWC